MHKLDPLHESMDLLEQEVSQDIWREKYRFQGENDPWHTVQRVCKAIYQHEKEAQHREIAEQYMHDGIWLPGGRITAGAGTERSVTLMNCYVMDTIKDDMRDIFRCLSESALTMQQGGGIGMDFSTLRPMGAEVAGVGADASGPISFMNVWQSMCKTIMSAGHRRGAMMGTLSDSHPDILRFIRAKKTADVLTHFNVSILVSDALMDAKAHDEDWQLYFNKPPLNKDPLGTFEDDDNVKQYIYEVVKARELWDEIIETTYHYAEPGVIFIDRVNDTNNLAYCEDIRATNPCGEQPLPPYGCCDLGHINLARLVLNPFDKGAKIDQQTLDVAIHTGVRFLDNVIDVTNYPIPGQKHEQINKRRIGLGVTGLANMLFQLNIRYGSDEAEAKTRRVMRHIANTAYKASAELAQEKAPFPYYHEDILTRPFLQQLDEPIQKLIKKQGLRNGVLLSLAPVGTGSLWYGNCSSGIEPVFASCTRRKVLQPDEGHKEYDVYDYGYLLYHKHHNAEIGSVEMPDTFITTHGLTVHEHIRMQAAVQEWVDASVSKTINCPQDMSIDEFKEVYSHAYALGCKGCTTYRPSPTRGSVLGETVVLPPKQVLPLRPDKLTGETYKVKWPSLESALYVTINEVGGKPFEMFIASRGGKHSEWMTALTLMISSIMRTNDDIDFVAQELQQVVSAHDSAWIGKKFYPSLVARIGHLLEEHLHPISNQEPQEPTLIPPNAILEVHGDDAKLMSMDVLFETCPRCGQLTFIRQEGCGTCLNCSYSNCG